MTAAASSSEALGTTIVDFGRRLTTPRGYRARAMASVAVLHHDAVLSAVSTVEAIDRPTSIRDGGDHFVRFDRRSTFVPSGDSQAMRSRLTYSNVMPLSRSWSRSNTTLGYVDCASFYSNAQYNDGDHLVVYTADSYASTSGLNDEGCYVNFIGQPAGVVGNATVCVPPLARAPGAERKPAN
jgi:hypothetical protein